MGYLPAFKELHATGNRNKIIKNNQMKIMRRIRFLMLCLLSVTLSIGAQNGKMAALKKKVAEINRTLPRELSDNVTLESIKVENGYVVQYCSGKSMYDENGKSLSRTYGEAFLEQGKNEAVRSMYAEYLEAGLGAKQVIRFKNGVTETMTFTMAELHRMLSFPSEAYSDLLLDIRRSRLALPMDTGKGMICTAFEFPKQEFMYVYEVDEYLYSIDAIQKNLNKNKYALLSEIVAGTSDLLPAVKLCVAVGYGLSMKYVGKISNKVAEMNITYKELKNCVE